MHYLSLRQEGVRLLCVALEQRHVKVGLHHAWRDGLGWKKRAGILLDTQNRKRKKVKPYHYPASSVRALAACTALLVTSLQPSLSRAAWKAA